MFTGIIQAVGEIKSLRPIGDDIALEIDCGTLTLDDVHKGDSIAVNGVCLTAVQINNTRFTAHVSRATLEVTTGLDQLQPVNLEKALRFSDRLGGHIVSGHVDGVGEVSRFDAAGECWTLEVQAPHSLTKYIASKGSISINGISLTVNHIDNDCFQMNIIPHTIANTTIQFFKRGTKVNIEVDMIARYVERMQEWANQN